MQLSSHVLVVVCKLESAGYFAVHQPAVNLKVAIQPIASSANKCSEVIAIDLRIVLRRLVFSGPQVHGAAVYDHVMFLKEGAPPFQVGLMVSQRYFLNQTIGQSSQILRTSPSLESIHSWFQSGSSRGEPSEARGGGHSCCTP